MQLHCGAISLASFSHSLSRISSVRFISSLFLLIISTIAWHCLVKDARITPYSVIFSHNICNWLSSNKKWTIIPDDNSKLALHLLNLLKGRTEKQICILCKKNFL